MPDDRRRYDSPLRRDQAEQTRARIAVAARELFLERGWAGTRVRDIARGAGIAEPTVYATYGSKVGLALALVDAVDAAAGVPQAVADLQQAADDPARQLAVLVAFDRRLFERGGDVIGLLRDARRSEPELNDAYEEGRRRGDAVRQRVMSSWPAGTLRAGVDLAEAIDTFGALCNIDVYRLLSRERGWSPDRIERWWCDSLVRLLLPGP